MSGNPSVRDQRRRSVGAPLRLAALLVLFVASASAAPDGVPPNMPGTLVEITSGGGRTCLVCGKPIVLNAAIIRYRGREFAVGEEELDEWAADPDRYFAQLQSRSALFDEATHDPDMSRGWRRARHR